MQAWQIKMKGSEVSNFPHHTTNLCVQMCKQMTGIYDKYSDECLNKVLWIQRVRCFIPLLRKSKMTFQCWYIYILSIYIKGLKEFHLVGSQCM